MTQSIHTCIYGTYILGETEKGICRISFDIKPPRGEKFVKGKAVDFENPKTYKLDLIGTPFQKEVWKTLRKIKSGTTKTYAQVAQMIGKPTAVRAVASAIAKNNIAILIPCHRVIRSDGTLGEFRWGTSLKKILLQSEGVRV